MSQVQWSRWKEKYKAYCQSIQIGLLGCCWVSHRQRAVVRISFPGMLSGRTCFPSPEHMSSQVLIFSNLINWLNVARPVILKPSLRKSSIIKVSLILVWFGGIHIRVPYYYSNANNRLTVLIDGGRGVRYHKTDILEDGAESLQNFITSQKVHISDSVEYKVESG